MKIFTSAQIHELDKYTIENEPISSIDLMERASTMLTNAIVDTWQASTPVVVFAGPGNNGGDALAVARMLTAQHYSVNVYLFNTTGRLSPDCEQNRERLKKVRNLKGFTEITQEFEPPTLTEDTLVIDGLFGSGLNKPLTGGFASVVKYINASKAKVVSIDIPSGMMTEDNTYNVRANIIRADMTLTLGSRKLCMMMADIQPLLGEVRVLDINLSVRQRCFTYRTPVNDSGAFINISFFIQSDKYFLYRFGTSFIHCKTLSVPVTGYAKLFELSFNRSSIFFLPLPGSLQEFFSSQFLLINSFLFQLIRNLNFR